MSERKEYVIVMEKLGIVDKVNNFLLKNDYCVWKFNIRSTIPSLSFKLFTAVLFTNEDAVSFKLSVKDARLLTRVDFETEFNQRVNNPTIALHDINKRIAECEDV